MLDSRKIPYGTVKVRTFIREYGSIIGREAANPGIVEHRKS